MIQTFIFVHDQKIILDFLKVKKFSSLGKVNYVFVGNKPVDQIENLENVIICRNLEHNIEDFPNLTSFTGWYALWKNNLINTDYINLFEYDINIEDNLENEIEENFKKGYDIIGFIPLSINDFNYVRNLQWIKKISQTLKSVYKIDIYNYINSLDPFTTVSVTSNHSMSKDSFDKYMNWMLPMLEEIKLSYYSGHEVERSISFFYLISKLKYFILQGNLKHFQFNSHGTQLISPEKFIKNYKNLL